MVIVIIGAVLIFGVLVFVHELGHFAAAKSVGIKVNEFAIGMGPVLLKKDGRETRYSLRAFPIGGFVRMEGEEEESDDGRSYSKKPGWARAIVAFAGSFMNYMLAVVLIFVLILSSGFATNAVGSLTPGNPAELAGMKEGDVIVQINANPISSWQDVLDNISQSTGETIDFVVERVVDPTTNESEKIAITSQVASDPQTGRRIVGITPMMQKDVLKSVQVSFESSFEMMKQMLAYIGTLFSGQGSVNDLVGPVGITKLVGDSVSLGWDYVVNLTAVISLNLAIVNMLPLPALDGGKLLFILIEGITRKKISEEIEGRIHFAGFVLLMALMLLITIKDVNVFILN